MEGGWEVGGWIKSGLIDGEWMDGWDGRLMDEWIGWNFKNCQKIIKMKSKRLLEQTRL